MDCARGRLILFNNLSLEKLIVKFIFLFNKIFKYSAATLFNSLIPFISNKWFNMSWRLIFFFFFINHYFQVKADFFFFCFGLNYLHLLEKKKLLQLQLYSSERCNWKGPEETIYSSETRNNNGKIIRFEARIIISFLDNINFLLWFGWWISRKTDWN